MSNYFSIKIIVLLITLSFGMTSMLNKDDNYSNHLELFIHQDIINNFLSSIGTIDGGGKIGGFDYKWDVSNFYIVIDEEKAEFYGNIRLKSGQFSRQDIIVGNVNVYYDELKI